MSDASDQFVAASKRRDWANALLLANGLSMEEMLSGMVAFGAPLLSELRAQSTALRAGVNLPRIQYAMDVVQNRRLPAVAPGDLAATGQVEAARRFLQGLSAPAGEGGDDAAHLETLVRALDERRLQAQANNVEGQIRALAKGGQWTDGHGNVMRASHEILVALAGLVAGSGTMQLLSLFRFKNGPHGEPQSDGSGLGRAVDISGYQGFNINLKNPANTPTTISGVAAVVGRLPKGNYALGLPRPGGGPLIDPKNDVFLPVTSHNQVDHSPTGAFRTDLELVQEPARAALRQASNGNSSARIKFMFPDGVDHLHLKAMP
jgi:hypothetical protein